MTLQADNDVAVLAMVRLERCHPEGGVEVPKHCGAIKKARSWPTLQDIFAEDVSAAQRHHPSSWPQNAQVWLHQVEAQFSLYHIASETTRYCHVASVFPPDVSSELSNVLSNPSDITLHLNTKVLERLMPSERVRLQQLLAEVDLGDRHPCHLLRQMRQVLGENNVSTHSALLRELFLQRLSQPIRLVLTAAGDVNLDRLAELADQVHDAAAPTVIAVSPPADTEISHLQAIIDELAASIAALRSPLQETRVPRSIDGALSHTREARSPSPPPLCCHDVHTFFFVAGKRPPGSLTAACDLPSRRSRLFMETEQLSGARFLIDMGAEISVVPLTKPDRSKSPEQSLRAANAARGLLDVIALILPVIVSLCVPIPVTAPHLAALISVPSPIAYLAYRLHNLRMSTLVILDDVVVVDLWSCRGVGCAGCEAQQQPDGVHVFAPDDSRGQTLLNGLSSPQGFLPSQAGPPIGPPASANGLYRATC
ncbi:hypothetical protein HPB50_014189 [Hyalomma asiaticum]|uniref:Uncharacterized protein n=1 Tax=Hyalomma asiaticum TaxID=266040 RepID=A0ACB7S9Q7_HYAAI|nr:hypothetical protein HPB50_014189 [Hyalomma asiaticum]